MMILPIDGMLFTIKWSELSSWATAFKNATTAKSTIYSHVILLLFEAACLDETHNNTKSRLKLSVFFGQNSLKNPDFLGSPTPLLSSDISSVSPSEDAWREANERGRGRRGRGWACSSVLLNALTCMKEEAFILGLLRGCTQIWNTHTLTGEVRAHKPRDKPDLPFYQSCFESC